jgi:hypothetical protein
MTQNACAVHIKACVIYLLIMVEDSKFSGHLPFDGKIALVTGSGRGIGRAVALHLAHKGPTSLSTSFGIGRQLRTLRAKSSRWAGKRSL